jgi:hypothetical protein
MFVILLLLLNLPPFNEQILYVQQCPLYVLCEAAGVLWEQHTEKKCYCILSFHLSSPAELRQSITNNL